MRHSRCYTLNNINALIDLTLLSGSVFQVGLPESRKIFYSVCQTLPAENTDIPSECRGQAACLVTSSNALIATFALAAEPPKFNTNGEVALKLVGKNSGANAASCQPTLTINFVYPHIGRDLAPSYASSRQMVHKYTLNIQYLLCKLIISSKT